MKHPELLLAFACLFATSMAAQDFHPYDLRCEHRHNPMGLDVPAPRLAWKTKAAASNWQQSAYQIGVATDSGFAKGKLVWDSGKVGSDASILLPYAGPVLSAGRRYYWRVRVWDAQGRVSPWSATAFWEMGLLARADWRAQWISAANDTLSAATPALLLRREFVLPKKIRSARAYVTARGLYELRLNGRKVGEDLLTPGWTVYPKRLQYQVYDVTAYLQAGPNAIGALVGEGWYRGGLGSKPTRAIYGKTLAFLAQMQVQYTDGTVDWILSDGTWRSSREGPIRQNDPYNGEVYDARMEQSGWDQAGFDARGWLAVNIADHPFDNLCASATEPVRAVQELAPVAIFKTPEGTWVADLGQNMVGWVRLQVQGPAGTKIVLRHAEVLDKKGNFYTDNLRKAQQRLEYTLKGGGPEVYAPRFAWMGFRYVAVEGFPGDLRPEHLRGIVIHSNLPATGTFECSQVLLNQLQRNIVWGQKGNFIDIPTDCPQRDERLGWTGDAQVFAATAAFNMDVAAFFDKWLQDLAAEQRPDGSVPWTAPDILDPQGAATVRVSAGWSDAAVMLPWTLYRLYGDRQLLERQYPSMRAWVEYMRQKAGDTYLYNNGSVFGDWFFYRPVPRQTAEPDAYTDRDFISTAFYAHCADLLGQTAQVLGKTSEAEQYAALFENIKRAFCAQYFTPAGRSVSDTQTSYLLPLMFGLLPEDLCPKAVAHLKRDILRQKTHLTTGFLGTPYLCHVLSQHGETALAHALLLQETYPSWLYPVKMGATTIWERWDGIKPDSTFQDPYVNSFNHYAYGAIGDWMYQYIGGIRALAPGYKQIEIAPVLSERLTYASTTYESPYGLIAVEWKKTADLLSLKAVIPPNTTARFRLPGAKTAETRLNGTPISDSGLSLQTENGRLIAVEAGSGTWSFIWKQHD